MSETRKFVCIVCPRGCALEVDVAMISAGAGPRAGDAEAGSAAGASSGIGALSVVAVRGNACKRGEVYGRGEVLDPRRSLTSTVRVEGFLRRRLPVRSSGEIPLGRLREAARALDSLVVTRPVTCGEVLARDFLGLGVEVVATDDLDV